MSVSKVELDDMLDGYITCALWSTNDESRDDGGDPLDDNYGPEHLAEYTLDRMRVDCERFARENENTLRAAFDAPGGVNGGAGRSWSNAGHDFWLTRNRHGCGFWETPDWPEREGQVLTKAADAFGEFYLYVGDDGMIHGGPNR